MNSLHHATLVRLSRWRRANGFWLRLKSRVAWLLLARLDPLLARRGFRGLF